MGLLLRISNMRFRHLLVLLFLAASLVAGAEEDRGRNPDAGEPSDPAPKKRGAHVPFTFRWSWEKGLYYDLTPVVPETRNLSFLVSEEQRHLRGHFGAKVQADAAAYWHDEDFGGIPDNVELRRFRIYTKGSTYWLRPLQFKLEVGWEDDQWYLQDGFLKFSEVPGLKTVTVGNFKTPMSLEAMESSSETTFMEDASVVEAFSPGIRIGVAAGGPRLDDRLTWNIGWFVQAQEFEVGDAAETPFGFIGRATWLALDQGEEESNRIIHLGISGSETRSADDTFRFRSRPESHLAPRLIDTGDIAADRGATFGLEAAALHGRFSLQSEYMQTYVENTNGSTHRFHGLYFYGSCFLTRDARTYDKWSGVFGRVRPEYPFSPSSRQYGALEIALRFSRTILADGEVNGGIMNIVMGGVNWYLNDYARWMINYGFVDVEDTEEPGNMRLGQTRLQILF